MYLFGIGSSAATISNDRYHLELEIQIRKGGQKESRNQEHNTHTWADKNVDGGLALYDALVAEERGETSRRWKGCRCVSVRLLRKRCDS
ncbi:hypothetical protein L2E82_28467 [Cichorium intybus]|uniref:Uncharacterized protein n=1 Tax=Cichorium intybus TaxID=13427 RepID=A0ACB9CVW0_CICIN|nr:hypothetical protein L2E82_28467 [Cichorium intybus]